MPENHTATELGECLEDVMKHWKLDPKKLTVMTTDNAANILKACREKKWCNITCFGHNLHLAITNSLAKEKNASRALGV